MRPRRRRSSTVAASLTAGLVLAGCSGMTAASGLPGFANGDVAATANDGAVVVTVAELDAAVQAVVDANPLEGVGEREAVEAQLQLQTELLTNELQIAIVQHVAEQDFGVVITDEDIAEVIATDVEDAGGEEAFEASLATVGQTRSSYERSVLVNLLIQEISAALVEGDPLTDEEVEAQYEQRASQFERVEARHILVDTEGEAVAALGRLDEGEDFATLATELSQDPGSAANGGSLGVNPRGTFVPEFEAAIWDGPAEIGEVLGPVETQFGWHLIVVDSFEVTPRAEALELVRAEIEASRGNDMLGAWASQAFADADPQVASRFGRWERTTQSVVNDLVTQPEGP